GVEFAFVCHAGTGIEFPENERLLPVNVARAKKDRPAKEWPIEGEGMVFSSLPAGVDSSGEGVGERRREGLPAMRDREPNRVHADRHGHETKANELAEKLGAISAP